MSPLYEVNLRTSVRRGSEHKMYIFVTANFCYIQECTHCTDSKQIGWMAAMNKMNNVDEPNSADKCLCCAFGIVKCVALATDDGETGLLCGENVKREYDIQIYDAYGETQLCWDQTTSKILGRVATVV